MKNLVARMRSASQKEAAIAAKRVGKAAANTGDSPVATATLAAGQVGR